MTSLLVFWPHREWTLGLNFSDTTPIISETNENMAVVRSDTTTILSKGISLDTCQQCNMGSELDRQQS